MNIYAQISRNRVRTWVIFALFVAFISCIFYLIGQVYGTPGRYFLLGFGISSISVLVSYFYADKLVLYSTGAHAATKEEYFDFYTVAENMAIAAGVPMPKLYVIDDPAPNAFATGRNPAHAVVCATTGLLTRLDRSELEGVIAHELSHVKNYDILLASIVTALVGTIAIVSDIIVRTFWWTRNDNESKSERNPFLMMFFILLLLLSPLVATLIQLAISRKREYLADASGALLTRYPEGLARALEKISNYPYPMRTASSATAHLFISNPFRKQTGVQSWFTGLFSTHPPTADRIRILRNM